MSKKQQRRTPIWTTLLEYCNKNVTYFDVPGHKKNFNANEMSKVMIDTFKYDINSGPEVDNLAHPTGVIAEGHNLLAKAFGSQEAYILTNGTTQGIHTLIASSIYPGQKILLPRNSHKSAINGVILAGGIPIFITPDINSEYGISNNISLKELKKTFKANPDAKALLLLNPTYFGVVCNLTAMVKFCREKGIIILTDEAHGAHFGFHPEFPKSGMQAKVDGTAVSFHKTMGSLSQTSALLWNNRDSGLQTNYIWQWSSILTTTSPSFLFMASVDAARSRFAVDGRNILQNALDLARYAREELAKIPGIKVLSKDDIGGSGAFKLDETKLVIKTDEIGYTGFEFYEELWKNYGIQLELGEVKVVMALISFNDTKRTIDTLLLAVKDIAINKKRKPLKLADYEMFIGKTKCVLSPREAIAKPLEEIRIEDAEGRIAADSVMYYPPGIPLILPGEVITKKIIEYHQKLVKNKARIITSAKDTSMVFVIRDIMYSDTEE